MVWEGGGRGLSSRVVKEALERVQAEVSLHSTRGSDFVGWSSGALLIATPTSFLI